VKRSGHGAQVAMTEMIETTGAEHDDRSFCAEAFLLSGLTEAMMSTILGPLLGTRTY
jgi:hypothetical protein